MIKTHIGLRQTAYTPAPRTAVGGILVYPAVDVGNRGSGQAGSGQRRRKAVMNGLRRRVVQDSRRSNARPARILVGRVAALLVQPPQSWIPSAAVAAGRVQRRTACGWKTARTVLHHSVQC